MTDNFTDESESQVETSGSDSVVSAATGRDNVILHDEPSSEDAGPFRVPTPLIPRELTRKLITLVFAIAAITALVDQLTKWWAIRALGDGRRIEIFGQFLSFRYLRNPGAAFGIGYGYTWILTIVVIGVILVIIRFLRRIGSRGWAWAFGLLLGGAIGNLIDRLFRYPGFTHGHVVDFIAYWNWFVGNVADIAIVVAAGLIIILSLKGVGIDGSIEKD